MAKRISVDRWLFVVTLVLVSIGLVMVFSASAVMAKERYHSGYFFLLRQFGWAVGGLIVMLIGMRIDYKKLKHPAVVFSIAWRDHINVDLGLLSRPCTQHAPLDSILRASHSSRLSWRSRR